MTRRSMVGMLLLFACGVLVGRSLVAPGTHDAGDVPRAAEAAAPGVDADTVWTCSMDPQVRLDRPGDCPLCGMDLIPTQASAGSDPTVRLSPGAQAVASIEVRAVTRRPVEHSLRAVGRIEFAEPLMAYLTARVPARVERVYADFTGTVVAQGDHLVDIYSPELVVAQQELLVDGPNADAARRKLLLLGVTQEQIDDIVRAGEPSTVLTLHAPIGGTVIEKSVREQMYLAVGDPLYTIADLSTVWMFADIYEFDLPWVGVGQPVSVSIEGAPGEEFAGTVAFVEPVVREATRTIRVRVNLPNPEGRLRPGMFARAVIHASLGADGRRAPSPRAGMWTCPMHPDVTEDAAGTCPLCGMDLQRIPGEAAAGTEDAHAASNASDAPDAPDAPDAHDAHDAHGDHADADHASDAPPVDPTPPLWVCPMDCIEPRDEPGRCPVCRMHLVPAAPPDTSPTATSDAPSPQAHASSATSSARDALLVVPASAVLDSGLRRIVWVEREPGVYEAVEVTLGPRADDVYPVLAGLAEGDRVVVRGAFFIDSQAQIEGRPSLLLPHGLDLSASEPTTPHTDH